MMRYCYLLIAFLVCFAASPVISNIGSPVDSVAKRGAAAVVEEAAASDYLDSVIDSVVLDLDATVSDSYGGSGQTWANLIASPADGAAQSDYDAANNGFTFTGAAGDPSAYWLANGTQYFNMPLNGVFNKMHRTDQATGFWIARTYRYITGAYFSTFGSGTWNPDDVGLSDYATGLNDDVNFWHSNGATRTLASEGSTLVSGTDYISIVSFDLSQSTNNVKFWLSQTTSVTQSLSAGVTTTGATEGFFGIGVTANENFGNKGNMANTARLYSFAAGNEFLDDAKAAAIINHLCERHNRNYTGSCL